MIDPSTAPAPPPGSLGARLRERRLDLGFTQGQVADEAGISRAHLSQIESGKIGMPTATLRRKLAAALGLRHVDLLIAAGELAEEETGDATISSEWRRLLPRLTDADRTALLAVARRLADRSRSDPTDEGA